MSRAVSVKSLFYGEHPPLTRYWQKIEPINRKRYSMTGHKKEHDIKNCGRELSTFREGS